MQYVFDASSLIYLGKAKLLDHLSMLTGKRFIPTSVYGEVVRKGFERHEPEAAYLDSLIKKHFFVVIDVTPQSLSFSHLSEADTDVLTLAKEKKAIAIIDEIYARDIAEVLCIERHGTVWLLLQFVKRKALTKSEAKKGINLMISSGFYLSFEMYQEVIKKIDAL